MADAGVDQYTFHVEPCIDVPFVCRKVKEAGMKVGYVQCLLNDSKCSFTIFSCISLYVLVLP
jgi:pentose-5-phosphate-3-epimerase